MALSDTISPLSHLEQKREYIIKPHQNQKRRGADGARDGFHSLRAEAGKPRIFGQLNLLFLLPPAPLRLLQDLDHFLSAFFKGAPLSFAKNQVKLHLIRIGNRSMGLSVSEESGITIIIRTFLLSIFKSLATLPLPHARITSFWRDYQPRQLARYFLGRLSTVIFTEQKLKQKLSNLASLWWPHARITLSIDLLL